MSKYNNGDIIWRPSEERIKNTGLYNYMQWLKAEKNLHFTQYNELWEWSVNNLETFWETVWDYTDVVHSKPYEQIMDDSPMPNTKWFIGAELNYIENIFHRAQEHRPAIYYTNESKQIGEMSWQQLRQQVASLANQLKQMGVNEGDRVVGYLPNIKETVVAFFATASIGAIWSLCSPDFGSRSVIDRFQQIEPTVFIGVDGYTYNGKTFDKREDLQKITAELPTLKHKIFVPYIQEETLNDWHTFDDLVQDDVPLTFTQVKADHPLWILYSSGTTGLPKAIVHSHGSITVEQLKMHYIQTATLGERTVFWYSSTGWVMWNLLVSSLINGSSIVLYDGSPFYPDANVLWDLVDAVGITTFGTGAPYLLQSAKLNMKPRKTHDLSSLDTIFSTGAPLTSDGFEWVYRDVKDDVWLASSSGGTDIAGGFVGGISIKPLKVGEIQGRLLGVHAHAFDDDGNSLTGEVGELVITNPMPTMPIFFWNDPDKKRYKESYFEDYPGYWKHGDWIKINEDGGCIIYGRSDSTINRSGVRMGTSDIYRVISSVDEVFDSLVIDLEIIGKSNRLLYFVVLKENATFNDILRDKIKEAVRKELSPRFMPDEIYTVADIPKTLNGKKLEVPIRKLLLGFNADKVISKDSMSNPDSLDFFMQLREQFKEDSLIGFQ